jgi:iron complex transport system substrate-binding protein
MTTTWTEEPDKDPSAMTFDRRIPSIDRRTLLGGLAAVLTAPRGGLAATATDATGRAITALERVARIYPAGPPAAVLLYTLAPDLLIGWLEPLGAAEREFLLPEIAARPQIPRLTGRGGTVNLEAVNSFKPDLIVDAGTVNASYTALAEATQQQTGIPYALFDGRFEQTAQTYRALGQLVGRADAADKLAGYAESTMATVKERGATVPNGARPRVYYARDKSGLQTGLGGSMIAEAIEFIGAHNVAAELHGAHGTVTLEQVRTWNPDTILTSDREFAANVRSDAGWAEIAAVKAGRIFASPRQPFGWVDFPPAVNRLIGLWWLGKIFYPDRFPEDMKALARDFYTLFYHVTPTAAQIEHVLAGSG